VADVQELPETQKTALLLREIDALSYEQIAEAMETTVPSVKSLLVRARVALAEAAEARLLTCEEVREELGRVAEGLSRTTPPLRRHLRTCEPCSAFRKPLRATNRALAALFPVGPLFLLKKTLLAHLGTSAAASSGTAAAASGGAAAAAGAAAQAGIGTLATKTVAGLAAAAIVTAGAVEVQHVTRKPRAKAEVAVAAAATPAAAAPATPSTLAPDPAPVTTPARVERKRPATAPKRRTAVKAKVTDDAATADKPAAKAPAAEEPAVLTEEHESATTTLPSTTGVAAPSEGAIAPGDPSGPYAPPPPTATTQPSPTPTPAPTPWPTPTPEPTPVPTPTPTPEPTPDPSPTPPEQR
jgi:hypothetical protein